jgi:hypothetical protein
MRKQLLATVLFAVAAISAQAQTNPTPFDLSTGDYSFTEWSAEAPAGSTPSNMAFHTTTDPSGDVYDFAANGTGDWNCAYNLTGRNRFFGHGANGIAMRATGSPQWDNCASGDAAETRYVGAIVLALNTTSRQDITVEWTGGTMTVGDGTPQPRVFALRMQYRLGTSATWTDVPGPVDYVSQTEGASQDFNTVLPAECANQAVVQVRWLYYQFTDGSGTRPELRLDDVEVSSLPSGATNMHEVTDTPVLSAFPNPSETGVFQLSALTTGVVFNMIGVAVAELHANDRVELTAQKSGVYVLRTAEGAALRLMR